MKGPPGNMASLECLTVRASESEEESEVESEEESEDEDSGCSRELANIFARTELSVLELWYTVTVERPGLILYMNETDFALEVKRGDFERMDNDLRIGDVSSVERRYGTLSGPLRSQQSKAGYIK